MKNLFIPRKTLVALALLSLLLKTPSFAMEGLQISVVSSNAVLTWPSTNDGETYLVQYRSNLISAPCTTVTDQLPASGSNTITFVDTSNIVTFPVLPAGITNSGGGGSPMPPEPDDTDNYEHINFITFIQDGMLLNNLGIKQAMQYAASQPGIGSFNANSMTVYGFWGLTFGLDN